MRGGGPTGPVKFGFPQAYAGVLRRSAKTGLFDGWNCLEFLGISRPK